MQLFLVKQKTILVEPPPINGHVYCPQNNIFLLVRLPLPYYTAFYHVVIVPLVPGLVFVSRDAQERTPSRKVVEKEKHWLKTLRIFN